MENRIERIGELSDGRILVALSTQGIAGLMEAADRIVALCSAIRRLEAAYPASVDAAAAPAPVAAPSTKPLPPPTSAASTKAPAGTSRPGPARAAAPAATRAPIACGGVGSRSNIQAECKAILIDAGKALSAPEVAALWAARHGGTPGPALTARIGVVLCHGKRSAFRRVGRGLYAAHVPGTSRAPASAKKQHGDKMPTATGPQAPAAPTPAPSPAEGDAFILSADLATLQKDQLKRRLELERAAGGDGMRTRQELLSRMR